MTLSNEEIKRLRHCKDVSDPKNWPWKVVLYRLIPDNRWVDVKLLEPRIAQWCAYIRREPPSLQFIQQVLKRMAEAGWVDRVKRRINPDLGSTHKDVVRPSYYAHWWVRKRDVDYDGNLVWCDWLEPMEPDAERMAGTKPRKYGSKTLDIPSVPSQQARRIIEKMGGVKDLAKKLGVDSTTVYRWTYPPERKGTHGHIPHEYHAHIRQLATQMGVKLTPADWAPEAAWAVAAENLGTEPADEPEK